MYCDIPKNQKPLGILLDKAVKDKEIAIFIQTLVLLSINPGLRFPVYYTLNLVRSAHYAHSY